MQLWLKFQDFWVLQVGLLILSAAEYTGIWEGKLQSVLQYYHYHFMTMFHSAWD